MMAVGSGGGGKGNAVRAGKAFVEATLDDTGLRAGLQRAKRLVLGFSAGLAAGGGLLAGLGGGVIGTIVSSFRAVVHEFDQIQKASVRLGTTAEIISSLGYAAEQSGSDLETLEKALAKNQMQLADNDAIFKQLGLSVEDLIALPLDERLKVQADALLQVENDAERAAAAVDLFGKSGRQLLPLMQSGSKGIADLQKEAAKVGKTISGEDARNAERAGDAISRAWTSVRSTFLSLGAALLPQVDRLEMISDLVIDGTKAVRDFVRENRALVLGILAGAAAVAALGFAFIGIGATLALITVAVGGFVSAFGAIATVVSVGWPVALGILAAITFATVGLAAAMEAFPDEMQEIGEAIGSIWSTVWGGITDTFNKTWGGITDALAAGDMKLAFKILVAGLDVLWKGFLLGLRIGWNTFKAVFVDGWHAAVTEIELAWNDLGAGIEDVMLGVLQMVAEKFGEFFTKVLGRAADLADKVGASEFAGSLRAIGGASGADFKMARELNELDRRAKEKEIRAAAAKEQADRDAARAAALLATALDLATAKATLEALTREAANKRIERENDKMMDKFLNDMMGAFAPQRKAAMNAIASAGTFGRFDARALGIGGGKTVEDKQLDELKGLRKDVKGMRGVAWGE